MLVWEPGQSEEGDGAKNRCHGRLTFGEPVYRAVGSRGRSPHQLSGLAKPSVKFTPLNFELLSAIELL